MVINSPVWSSEQAPASYGHLVAGHARSWLRISEVLPHTYSPELDRTATYRFISLDLLNRHVMVARICAAPHWSKRQTESQLNSKVNQYSGPAKQRQDEHDQLLLRTGCGPRRCLNATCCDT